MLTRDSASFSAYRPPQSGSVQPTQETPLPDRRLSNNLAPRQLGSALQHQELANRVDPRPSSLFPQSEISTRTSPMAGSQGIQQGPRVLIIAIALAAAIAAAAQAQTPSLPSPTAPSDFASVAGGPETFVQPTFAQPTGLFLPTMPVKALRRRLPSSRWGSSTRSPSRSAASPIRTPGGRCRSRRSSARVGTRPGCRRPTVRAALPGKAGSMPRTATCTGCGSSRSLSRSTTPRGATATSGPTRSWRR